MMSPLSFILFLPIGWSVKHRPNREGHSNPGNPRNGRTTSTGTNLPTRMKGILMVAERDVLPNLT